MGKTNTREKNKEHKIDRLGEENLNHQNCIMRIAKYNNYDDIFVEFQDKYKAMVHTTYYNFKKGNVKNPYYPSVYNVGIIGVKYRAKINAKMTKEYMAWNNMLKRCYNKDFKNKCDTYENATCCDEWLLFENFYEWLHSQPNFDSWYNGDKWAVDKDILFKGNKTYSPETCCLVPPNVNSLFLKCDKTRGTEPIGVNRKDNGFQARCQNPLLNNYEYIGFYGTETKAFYAYKRYKEDLIKQIAKIEYGNGNITKQCYNAMMSYEVEITD